MLEGPAVPVMTVMSPLEGSKAQFRFSVRATAQRCHRLGPGHRLNSSRTRCSALPEAMFGSASSTVRGGHDDLGRTANISCAGTDRRTYEATAVSFRAVCGRAARTLALALCRAMRTPLLPWGYCRLEE